MYKEGFVRAAFTTSINFRNHSLTELNMVTTRLTDIKNAGYSSSGAKRSEVPLKR